MSLVETRPEQPASYPTSLHVESKFQNPIHLHHAIGFRTRSPLFYPKKNDITLPYRTSAGFAVGDELVLVESLRGKDEDHSDLLIRAGGEFERSNGEKIGWRMINSAFKERVPFHQKVSLGLPGGIKLFFVPTATTGNENLQVDSKMDEFQKMAKKGDAFIKFDPELKITEFNPTEDRGKQKPGFDPDVNCVFMPKGSTVVFTLTGQNGEEIVVVQNLRKKEGSTHPPVLAFHFGSDIVISQMPKGEGFRYALTNEERLFVTQGRDVLPLSILGKTVTYKFIDH